MQAKWFKAIVRKGNEEKTNTKPPQVTPARRLQADR